MRSTFYGLEVARTGLYISQKGLDVTGHNISNVDTAGYTRQRLALNAIDPFNSVFQMKPLTRGLVGGGVQVQLLEQIRNGFLDRQYRTEQSSYSHWATRTTGLGYLESLFDDASNGNSFTGAIQNLFGAFDELVGNSSDMTQRTVTRSAAGTMISSMKTAYDTMVEQYTIQNESVKATADRINSLADSLSVLNEAIYRFEWDSMQTANDLRDKRNLLLDELSALVDIEYNEDSLGKLTVKVAGEVLVSHKDVNKIQYDATANPYTGADDLYQLYFNQQAANPALSLLPGDPGYNPVYDKNAPEYDPTDPNFPPATITVKGNYLTYNDFKGGELMGHLELRDSTTPPTGEQEPGIPYYIEQLNILARAIVTEVNALHKQGYTYPNPKDGTTSRQGVNFFDDGNGDISKINAGNMALSADVLASVWNIACSSEAINLNSAGTAVGGNQELAKQLAALFDNNWLPNADTTGINSIKGFLSSLIGEFATAMNKSSTLSDTLASNVLNVDNNRLSIAGVSLDEEMTSLMKYQHAYQGASRVITAMDEALDLMINRMGLVGRG